MEKNFWETVSKRITRELQNEVLSDVIVAIQKELSPSGCLTIDELTAIISNLRQEYGN